MSGFCSRFLLTAVSLLMVCACTAPDGSPGGSTDENITGSAMPDVVLVLIDTFRPDHLGVLGYERETAPFLEGLLRRSTVFRRAFSTSSWTAPSTSSLFTSLYPNHHGVIEGFLAHKKRVQATAEQGNEKIILNRLPQAVTTLPEILQQAGYATLGVASNINIGKEIGFDRGFDLFHHLRDRSAEKLAERVKEWRLGMGHEQPSFIYMHFNDVHEPYEPRAPWYEEGEDELSSLVAAYDSEISYLDGVLESLYQDLSWDRRTLLVVVSDHGEEFQEHGQIGHQFSLYDELMRVLITFSSADLKIPARFDEAVNVSLIDVAPTILDLLGLSIPEDRDGVSLAPLLRAERVPKAVKRAFRQRVLFAHRSHYQMRLELPQQHIWAALRGPWKYLELPAGPRLFHLEKDRAEKKNRRAGHPEIAADLSRQLEEFQAAGFHQGEVTEVEIDEATRKSLEALGYVQ